MKNKSYSSQEIAEIISSQFENQVAFFNIKDKNAFFFVAPDEARIAMDYIKQWRINGFNQINREKKLDEYVKTMMNEYSSREIETIIIRDAFSPQYRFSLDFVNHSFLEMEKEDRIVDALVISARTYAEIRMWGKTIYNEASVYEIKHRGVFGYIYTADIYVSKKVNDYDILVVSMTSEKGDDFMVKRIVYIDHDYLKGWYKRQSEEYEKSLRIEEQNPLLSIA